MSDLKIEKVGKNWKVFKLEVFFGQTFKTLIGVGKTKAAAMENAKCS